LPGRGRKSRLWGLGATEILFSKKLANNSDGNYKKILMEKYKEEFMTPKIAAEKGYITEVISPEETRIKITKGFQILRNKKTDNSVYKKHGNIPL
jgi:acetyl-CoA carboxylase carboxyltransferase component